MTPAEREEALERREANATLLAAKLEKDRAALEAEIAASAAASKAASAINRALQADAAKKVKGLEAECVAWEAKLARLRAEAGKLAPAAPAPAPGRSAIEVEAERAHVARDRTPLDEQRAAFEREAAETRAKLGAEAHALADLRSKLIAVRSEIEGGVKAREAEVRRKEASLVEERKELQAAADSLVREEAQQHELRAKLEAQVAAVAAKEVMFEERSRQLQERLKNFART
jgi:chromosome segregation ATPase